MLHRLVELAQYVALRYTESLALEGAVASVGSTGDSYDNALADAFNSLYKAELIRNRGPWKAIDDLPATADAALASLSQTRVDSRHNCYSDDGVSTWADPVF